MRTPVYWALSGIGGIQRMYPFTIKALQSCGYEVHVATNHDINPEDIMKYHGVKITKFLSMVDNYDFVYVDTPYVGPIFKYSVPRRNNLIFYLHASVKRDKPVIPIVKPHRIFMHVWFSARIMT